MDANLTLQSPNRNSDRAHHVETKLASFKAKLVTLAKEIQDGRVSVEEFVRNGGKYAQPPYLTQGIRDLVQFNQGCTGNARDESSENWIESRAKEIEQYEQWQAFSASYPYLHKLVK